MFTCIRVSRYLIVLVSLVAVQLQTPHGPDHSPVASMGPAGGSG